MFDDDSNQIESYLQKGRFSPKTEAVYKGILKRFEEACDGRFWKITQEHILQWLEGSASKKNIALSALRGFFGYLEGENEIPLGANPCRDIAPFTVEKRDHALSEDEFQKMILALPKTQTGKEYKFVLQFLRYTGVRTGELASILALSNDIENGILRIGQNKRILLFPLWMRKEIRERIIKNRGKLFTKNPHHIWYCVRRACELAGLNCIVQNGEKRKIYKISPHSFRGLFKRDLKKHGVTTIQTLLGFATQNTEKAIEEYRGLYEEVNH